MNPAGENTGTGKNSLFPFGVCAWRDHFSPSCLSGLEYLGDAFPLALPFILPFIIILSLFKSVLVYRYVFREDSVTALSLPGFRRVIQKDFIIAVAIKVLNGKRHIDLLWREKKGGPTKRIGIHESSLRKCGFTLDEVRDALASAYPG